MTVHYDFSLDISVNYDFEFGEYSEKHAAYRWRGFIFQYSRSTGNSVKSDIKRHINSLTENSMVTKM